MDKQQRLVLWICILASFVAFLDGSIVNVALPAIAREFGGGFVVQQWVVDAYMITLGALMLIAGSLSGRFGPRWFMAAGPAVAGVGFLSMLFVGQSANYFVLLPGILLFGLGLSITVAPLTSAILDAIDSRESGIGSAINNAVARIAGLVAIAAIGTIVGSSLGLAGFHRSIVVTAGLMLLGGTISALGIQNPPQCVSR